MTRTNWMTPYATLVMFLCTAVRVARNVPWSGKISCDSIRCDRERPSCPPWTSCDLHRGFCSPCSRCKHKDDYDEARYTSPPNCQYPTECLTSYDPLPSDVCPSLEVKKGYQCSGKCVPCAGTFGYFLGTVCRFRCPGGDPEVFACTFVNERAQWNVTFTPTPTPITVNEESFSTPITVKEESSSTPITVKEESSSTPITVKEESSSKPAYTKGSSMVTDLPFGASTPELVKPDIIIVVVAMTVVVVVVASGFAVIWRVRRGGRPKQPLTPTPPPPPSPPAPSPPMESSDMDEVQEMCPLMDPEERPRPVATVHDERADEETDAACSQQQQQQKARCPVETSDHETSDHETSDQILSIQETQQDQPNVVFFLEDQQGQKMMDSVKRVVDYGSGTRRAVECTDVSDPSSTNIVSLHSDYRTLTNSEQNGGLPHDPVANFLKCVRDGGYNVYGEGEEETTQKQIHDEEMTS